MGLEIYKKWGLKGQIKHGRHDKAGILHCGDAFSCVLAYFI